MPYVLIVDDDEDIVEAMTLVLRLEGFEVMSAATEDDAIDIARRFRLCMALVDFRMPGFDVRSLISRLHGLGTLVTLCTATEGAAELVGMTGADFVLFKPFAIEDLLSLVHRAVDVEAATPSSP